MLRWFSSFFSENLMFKDTENVMFGKMKFEKNSQKFTKICLSVFFLFVVAKLRCTVMSENRIRSDQQVIVFKQRYFCLPDGPGLNLYLSFSLTSLVRFSFFFVIFEKDLEIGFYSSHLQFVNVADLVEKKKIFSDICKFATILHCQFS